MFILNGAIFFQTDNYSGPCKERAQQRKRHLRFLKSERHLPSRTLSLPRPPNAAGRRLFDHRPPVGLPRSVCQLVYQSQQQTWTRSLRSSMGEGGPTGSIEIAGQNQHKDEGGEVGSEAKDQNLNILEFLDSLDSYLILMDSLSLTLRQGWFELAGARHSMGASRINSALLDLKNHSAATHLHANHHDFESSVREPLFRLCKWASSVDTRECCSSGDEIGKEKMQEKSDGTQIRRRGIAASAELQEKVWKDGVSQPAVNNMVQKERAKSLSVFGTLVSPKLRAAQFSFETALETLVQIANMRLSMLSAFDEVKKELDVMKP